MSMTHFRPCQLWPAGQPTSLPQEGFRLGDGAFCCGCGQRKANHCCQQSIGKLFRIAAVDALSVQNTSIWITPITPPAAGDNGGGF